MKPKTSQAAPLILVLDAMGVIYSVADDVADLLCPFIQEYGGRSDRSRVEALYREASLGCLSAPEFWRAVGLDPAVEDNYLARLQLSPGILEFLSEPPPELAAIWCLSNDVSEWSRKLRERFGLTQFIRGFVISGDLGARKPDAAAFDGLLARTAVNPNRIIFVDDRPANLEAAGLLGLNSVLFSPTGARQSDSHPTVANFDELRSLIAGSLPVGRTGRGLRLF